MFLKNKFSDINLCTSHFFHMVNKDFYAHSEFLRVLSWCQIIATLSNCLMICVKGNILLFLYIFSSKGSTTTICAKCAQNVKHYGKVIIFLVFGICAFAQICANHLNSDLNPNFIARQMYTKRNYFFRTAAAIRCYM